MAIKMRISKNEDATCLECGDPKEKVLEMYDICIGDTIFTICDRCNNQLFTKTLRASCSLNGKTKSQRDMNIIKRRANAQMKAMEKESVSINEALKGIKGGD